MITALFFLAVSQAKEPPELPTALKPVQGQCEKSIPIRRGSPFPLSIVSQSECHPEEVEASCSGVLIPTSQAADLVVFRKYAETCHSLFKLETETLEQKLKVMADNENPVSYWQSKEGQRMIGRLEGAGAVLLSVGFAVGIAQAF